MTHLSDLIDSRRGQLSFHDMAKAGHNVMSPRAIEQLARRREGSFTLRTSAAVMLAHVLTETSARTGTAPVTFRDVAAAHAADRGISLDDQLAQFEEQQQ